MNRIKNLKQVLQILFLEITNSITPLLVQSFPWVAWTAKNKPTAGGLRLWWWWGSWAWSWSWSPCWARRGRSRRWGRGWCRRWWKWSWWWRTESGDVRQNLHSMLVSLVSHLANSHPAWVHTVEDQDLFLSSWVSLSSFILVISIGNLHY